MQQRWLEKGIILTSDFRPSDFMFPLEVFKHCIIKISDETQRDVKYEVDSEGFMEIEVFPNKIYENKGLKNIQVYFPEGVLAAISAFDVTILVDGEQIGFGGLSESEQEFMEDLMPVVNQISETVVDAFLFMNLSSISYFVLGVIGFFNLSLLYLFLFIRTLPSFAQIFLMNITVIFFQRGSLSQLLYSVLDEEIHVDFSNMEDLEKVPDRVNQNDWFGELGLTSNFLNNNFESLLLFGFLIFKFAVFKVIVKCLLKEKYKFLNISFYSFFQEFTNEIVVVLPFFVIPFVSIAFQMGETDAVSKLNCSMVICCLFSFLMIGVLGYCQADRKENKAKNKKSGKGNTKQIPKEKQKEETHQDTYLNYLMFLVIPVFIALRIKALFFLSVGILIAYVTFNLCKSRRVLTTFAFVTKMMTQTIWVLYHLSFLFLFVMELIDPEESPTMQSMIKIVGFIVIILILLGATIDILIAFINILILLFNITKKILVYLKSLCFPKGSVENSHKKSLPRNSTTSLSKFNSIKIRFSQNESIRTSETLNIFAQNLR